MKRQVFRVNTDGFNGAWYPCAAKSARGIIALPGDSAEDDVLWDTCRYIRRMVERLDRLPHDSDDEAWLYEHGTHFALAYPPGGLRASGSFYVQNWEGASERVQRDATRY